MSNMIHLDAPNVGELEKRYLNTAIDNGYVSSVGPFVTEFEDRFAAYLGVRKAVSTQSGTAAIHRALHELKIGRGDEVIVPALTFIATVNPVTYVGAKPVFVDVDRRTWNIDPDAVSAAVTPKTKAIIPVHLYGNPCDMDRLTKIAGAKGIHIIEDATESLGATYAGRHTGSFGDFGCFSFNGNKVITTGGGGMVVGSDLERLRHIKFIANQAKDTDREHFHPEVGYNERMTNIEAGLGLAQMERLASFIEKKKRFNAIYKEELAGLEHVRFQEEYTDAKSSWWFTCLVLEEGDVDVLRQRLHDDAIPSRRVFIPLPEHPPYRTHKQAEYPNAYSIYASALCLPSSTLNNEDDIRGAAKRIKQMIMRGGCNA